MGLDISYFKNCTRIECDLNADCEPVDRATGESLYLLDVEYAQVYVNQDFEDRADGLSQHSAWSYEDGDSFNAGSYSWYSRWRDHLARFAGYAPKTDATTVYEEEFRHFHGAWTVDGGPFWELIAFSDCEGTIGPKTSAKLAKDFADNRDAVLAKAAEMLDAREGGWFSEGYNNWQKAFEAAAQNGFVSFH